MRAELLLIPSSVLVMSMVDVRPSPIVVSETRVTTEPLFVGPVNDNYPGAINVFKGRRPFSTLTATQSSEGQGATDCWSTGGVERDIWFLFEASGTGTWTASLCDSSTSDTRLVVYTGDFGVPGSEVACGDDECGSHASATFAATQGQLFYIQVGTMSAFGTANGVLDIDGP
jgi:hypothetical protein